jgi:hypothetical protein
VECWGDDTFDQLEVPSGTYVAISAAWEETCGLLDDHTITCWGLPSGGITGQQPEGEWVAISCMYDICGAVTSNGEATWWGRRTFGGAAPPDVGIVDIHAGARGLGVVDEAGDVQVWWESVDGTYGSYAVPSGSAVTASVLDASESGCWLDAGGWPTCWGGADDMFFDMPGGVAFADLSMSSERACAVTSAGELDCWGDCPSSDDCDMLRPPVGLFSQVSVGGHHACAVNAYGGIECWGGGSYGEDVPPE